MSNSPDRERLAKLIAKSGLENTPPTNSQNIGPQHIATKKKQEAFKGSL